MAVREMPSLDAAPWRERWKSFSMHDLLRRTGAEVVRMSSPALRRGKVVMREGSPCSATDVGLDVLVAPLSLECSSCEEGEEEKVAGRCCAAALAIISMLYCERRTNPEGDGAAPPRRCCNSSLPCICDSVRVLRMAKDDGAGCVGGEMLVAHSCWTSAVCNAERNTCCVCWCCCWTKNERSRAWSLRPADDAASAKEVSEGAAGKGVAAAANALTRWSSPKRSRC
ncbi:hypothetical protein T484DRAFT_1977983 [Baffinella frigidus]|nr:hypothetical protein T484DRAFT_1977983 [Cryptophyta sp. CCMP2293]